MSMLYYVLGIFHPSYHRPHSSESLTSHKDDGQSGIIYKVYFPHLAPVPILRTAYKWVDEMRYRGDYKYILPAVLYRLILFIYEYT